MLAPLRFIACGSLGALYGPLLLSTVSDKDSLSDVLLFSSASLSSSEWMSTKCSSSSSSYKATKCVILRHVHVNVFRGLQRRSWKYFTRQIVKLTIAVSGFKYVGQQQHFGVDFTTQLNWNPINNHNSMQLYWAPAELCHITNKRTEKKSPDCLWLFWLARISS